MAHVVELQGIRTWYDERGTGEPLVLLHGGGVGVDARMFAPNLSALAAQFQVFLPERRGHGHTPDVEGPYSYELMAQDTCAFLELVVGSPARLFGVSDGAVVALLVAHQRPDLVKQLICAAGPFHRSGWRPSAIAPGQGTPAFLISSYAEVSPDGKAHFKVVEQKLDQMHALGPTLTPDDLTRIGCRTLVMVGDDDQVLLEHTLAFYRALPRGELAVVPGTSHGLFVEKPGLCNSILLDFLTRDPVATMAPIRRT